MPHLANEQHYPVLRYALYNTSVLLTPKAYIRQPSTLFNGMGLVLGVPPFIPLAKLIPNTIFAIPLTPKVYIRKSSTSFNTVALVFGVDFGLSGFPTCKLPIPLSFYSMGI